MRILLIGEYSGFHNALKKGLQQLGHQVTIIGHGDGFKKFPVDINVGSDYYRRNWWREKFKVAWYKLTGNNLEDRLRLLRFRESVNSITNYDIIQFINSNPIGCEPDVEWKIIETIIQNNPNAKAFLIACGDDYPYSKYLTEHHKGYSILEPVKEDISFKKHFIHTYKYLKKGYHENYKNLVSYCKAVIPSHTDFLMALQDEPKATEIIPSAVNIDALEYRINKKTTPVEIFMGINRGNYYKKGIPYFEKALTLIKEKYGSRVTITVAENLPYSEYINAYKSCHILLDQVLSYDQGYNALEAMAQGKVVFAGAGKPFLEAYQLTQAPLIDAQPDIEYLVNQLSDLIESPDKIIEIGQQARAFIEKHHHYINIAKRYEEKYINIG